VRSPCIHGVCVMCMCCAYCMHDASAVVPATDRACVGTCLCAVQAMKVGIVFSVGHPVHIALCVQRRKLVHHPDEPVLSLLHASYCKKL
jgi:hypothetical protein